jgi:thiol-disulfide isomerase/thioredoxin
VQNSQIVIFRFQLPLALFFTLSLGACCRGIVEELERQELGGENNSVSQTILEQGSLGFVVKNIPFSNSSVDEMIATEMAVAKTKGLRPYVEFWAPWCGPCMAIKHSLNDPSMKDAFKGTYIIQFNVDNWGSKAELSGFNFRYIPVFIALNDQGKPNGKSIHAGAWEENIPANMAPPLRAFFQQK